MEMIDWRKETNPPPGGWATRLARPMADLGTMEKSVDHILQEVRTQGDEAVRRYSLAFDKVRLDGLEVSKNEIQDSAGRIPEELKAAIEQAGQNITRFHESQSVVHRPVETLPGLQCWTRNTAIERVGLYIPGGTAPLFSTLLMLGIPASLAGCREITVCSPPDTSGRLHPAILYTARLVGATRVFRIGGVQAIGAMAFGTESVPKSYKIFGPGNQYVTCAKQLIQKEGVAIDLPAGPSELAVIADASAKPAFVAADLLSQAEHGIDSQVILVCFSVPQFEAIQAEIKDQLNKLPRKNIALRAMENSWAILVKDVDEGLALINAYAPEHLILSSDQAGEWAPRVLNAGSVFLGHFSPESAGDYATGTNHVLPTNGYSRSYSGVSVESFQKKITFQQITPLGLRSIAGTVQLMAEAEGLQAHAAAISIRMKDWESTGE
jgi:histidinol dehydrogenase